MKSISSSIVVLSGSLMVADGSLSSNRDAQMVVCFFGAIVAVVALAFWLVSSGDK